MAATVVCDGTVINECDATTGWSPTPTVITSDPDPIELTGCLGYSCSNETSRIYETGTWDLSSSVIGQWFMQRAALDTFANGGVGFYVSDGTNVIVYHVAGSDVANFRHDAGPCRWEFPVIDTDSPPSTYTTVSGSESSLDWSSAVRWGWQFINGVKAVGSGVLTVMWDISRYFASGEGLTISGGTSSVPGDFDDVADADSDTATLKAFGVLRRLGSGLYGTQLSLNWGSASADSWFEHDGFSLSIEDRGLDDDKILLTMVGGEATYENHLVLTNGSIKSAGSAVEMDFSASNVTEIDLSGTVVELAGGPMTCATDSYAIAGHTYAGATFRGCGLVTFGQTDWEGASILASTVAADASASAWNVATDPDGYLDGLTVSKGAASHHAIEFGTSSPLTMTIRDCDFSGFNASHAQTDSTFHVKRTSGTVTINAIGCTGNLTYKTDGATVVIVSSVGFVLTNVVSGTMLYVEAEAGGSLTDGDVMLGPVVVSTDPYSTSVVGSQPFKATLAHASGATKYEPIIFLDTTGSGYSRRIEQSLDE